MTEIDAVIDSASYRALASRFSVSKSALQRHRSHLIRVVGEVEGDQEAVLDRLRKFDEEMDEVVRGIQDLSRYDRAERGRE